MHRALAGLAKCEAGAVAPTVALSLFGLLAAGGLAFDYARLASLDTELQDAADHAALAAVTQLDGTSTAITRATNASNNLLLNKTLFANDQDPSGRSVTIASLTFYEIYNQSDDTGTTTTDPVKAKYVEVTVGARKAFYALTPVVALLNSGNIAAKAIAGLGSAVCNVPPMMFCPPSDDFPTSSDVGKGVMLQPGPSGTGAGFWAPGDYGYLDFGNGASGLKTNLGANGFGLNCISAGNGIPTEPGNKASVTDGLNTRFDVYDKGLSCQTGSGDNCPSDNTRKDMVVKEVTNIDGPAGTTPPHPACSVKPGTFEQNNAAHGFTRDACHVDGTCTSKFGDGVWDKNGYFAANHSSILPSVAGPHRYDVYKWEIANINMGYLDPQLANPSATPTYKAKGKSGSGTYTFTNLCTYSKPINGTALPASSTQKDRRVLTVAAVDCSQLSGKKNVKVLKWVDVFLVEPSLDSTSPYPTGKSQIYGEIIGLATKPNGNTAFQYYSRNTPYLIK